MRSWILQNSLGQCNIWAAGLPCWPCWPCWDVIFVLIYQTIPTPPKSRSLPARKVHEKLNLTKLTWPVQYLSSKFTVLTMLRCHTSICFIRANNLPFQLGWDYTLETLAHVILFIVVLNNKIIPLLTVAFCSEYGKIPDSWFGSHFDLEWPLLHHGIELVMCLVFQKILLFHTNILIPNTHPYVWFKLKFKFDLRVMSV